MIYTSNSHKDLTRQLCWKIQGLGWSDASHSQGLQVRGCEMHQSPSALGFPTQLSGSNLIPIVKGWICQGTLIWHQREVPREQGPIRALASFTFNTEKPVGKHAKSTTFRLFIEGSLFRLTGCFHPLVFIYLG